MFAAGTRKLVGAGLVDSGSGYDAQNDLPVHIGLGTATRVDIEVTFSAAGKRVVTRLPGVEPSRRNSRTIPIRIGGPIGVPDNDRQ